MCIYNSKKQSTPHKSNKQITAIHIDFLLFFFSVPLFLPASFSPSLPPLSG